MKLKCPFCHKLVELDKDNNKKEKYIQCDNPYCCSRFENIYFEET